jgi:hypothetical protein
MSLAVRRRGEGDGAGYFETAWEKGHRWLQARTNQHRKITILKVNKKFRIITENF